MKTKYIDENDSRRSKEFVYEQWRKLLCISIVEEDVSNNQFTPKDITSEEVRTIFDLGYKLAMHQTKASLKSELSVCSHSSDAELIERLNSQIDDRLETHKCLVTYSNCHDESLYLDALRRDAEFFRYAKDDLTKWTHKKM